ncbi:SDR family oxidoreductase [Embleya hyalina]|uniref:Phthioceranic/hydroxyphthioceranic acid synthase n=1 Tax=Embleya hyalina TaxID=516124 RepID=A0A401Z556_9ACTN|nr:SDR family oxidoreductase [Embleya hyalina]GCE01956.1 phthioceranic/hydroxyphthioceranic acid synthase [Embleya hyalina]
MFDLQGKIALVTGGGKGVGRVIARKFVEHGATVVINCFHSPDAARATQAELRAAGGEVHLVRASVARRPRVEEMFERIGELVGGIDILVNNAASGALLPHADLEEQHWQRAFDTNLKGSLWCSELAAPLMAARGGGSIVNLSSIGAGLVIGNYLSVGTSKAAVEALTRYLAVELAPDNIRVNTASCSLIEGDVARLFPRAAEMRDVTVAATPLGRLASEADLANVVLFLASEAAGWVTGQVLLADGGLSLAGSILSPPGEPARRVAPAAVAGGDDDGGDPTDDTDTVAAATTYDTADAPDAANTPDSANAPGTPDGTNTTDPDARTIAIVGMGLVVPGADTPEEFWRVRTRGDVVFSEPGDRWDLTSFHSPDPDAEDRTYSRAGGYITSAARRPDDPAEEFTAHWLRHALRQALDGVARREDDRWSFVVGYTADGSQHLEEATVAAGLRGRLRDLLPEDRRRELGERLDDLIRERLPHAGPSPEEYLPHQVGHRAMRGLLPADTEPLMVDTACSSSLYAIDIGVKNLLSGTSDVAACGGAFGLGPRGSTLFAKLHGLSRSGRVRALDKDSDGVLFSDGAGVVILKTLRRARADGDRILGVLAGIGTSSDGKGKAVYAPSADGQRLAVSRAQRAAGLTGADIDWVVAHATGTPAGDLAEFDALRDTMASNRDCRVTSNKSLIGHTGWAAGVVSLIEVLLGFAHERIPAQFRFDEPPAEFRIDSTNLEIPTSSRAWPASAHRPRTAAVSGFGFGGTNAHLIVRDRPATTPAGPARRAEGRLAVVGWSAALPGDPSPAEVRAWLRGEGPEPAARFGDSFPLPSVAEVRIPPATLRTIDRCQLMILRCVGRLRPALGDFWSSVRDTTGVLVGHLGPTRNATSYALRCYLDHLERVAAEHPGLGSDPDFKAAFGSFRETVRALVPPGNENSFPGIMPNVIAARVANHFDFHGLNLTVDTGFSGGFAAVRLAEEYLRWGDLDLALVCGINGNSTAELRHVLGDALARSGEIGEGAFMLALALETRARAAGLPILGTLAADDGRAGPDEVPEIRCDPTRARRSHLAGDAARSLIEALVSPAPVTAVSCADPLTGRTSRMLVRGPGRREPAASLVRRHVVRLEAEPYERVGAPIPALGEETLVLTDRADLAAALATADPGGAIVVCTDPSAPRVPGRHVLAEVDPAALDALIRPVRDRIRHLRVVTDLGDPARGVTDAALGLHDALFLALRSLHGQLRERRGTFATLLLGGLPEGTLHPVSGLFTGLVKSAALELGGVRCWAVVTGSSALDPGLARLAAESCARHTLPVVVYDGSLRKCFVPRPAPTSPAGAPLLDRSSVVVGVGGARGITAETLVALAESTSARIWVLGSNPLDAHPPEVFADAGDAFARRRPEFVRSGLRTDPGVSVAELGRRFDRLLQARTARANLDRMAAHSGADRVRYLTCDVRDPAAVRRAFATIHAADGRIDLLVNGAGLNRGASLGDKRFEEFRRIRDVKVRGYRNLKQALAAHPPAVWCNFGSLVGFTGQEGEADYAAANDFLASAAGWANLAEGADEYTIGWTLWRDVGLGADPVTAAFMARSGQFSGMGTGEGVGHFLAELGRARHEPSVLHIGDTERAAIEARMPGLLRAAEALPPAFAPAPAADFYLGRRVVDEPDRLLVERELDPETDGYLADHLVDGVPTLPGTLVPEIAAEAALALSPGWCVTALSELGFSTFLRVYPGRAKSPFRIDARVRAQTPEERVVAVRVVSDVRAPQGTLLREDRLHFEATVHLRREPIAAPTSARWPASVGEVAVPDPYHVPNPAVLLTGAFVSTTDTRVHPYGNRATFVLPPARRHAAFARFVLPAVLLDGLARVAVLTPGRFVPLAAPVSVRRIDVFDRRNDVELADAYPEGVDLYCTPKGVDLTDPGVVNTLSAVAPDGRTLLRMTGLRGVVLGYLDTVDGGFRSVEQVRRATADPGVAAAHA